MQDAHPVDVTATLQLRRTEGDKEEGSAACTSTWPQGLRHRVAAVLSKAAPKAGDILAWPSNPARHGRSWENIFGT